MSGSGPTRDAVLASLAAGRFCSSLIARELGCRESELLGILFALERDGLVRYVKTKLGPHFLVTWSEVPETGGAAATQPKSARPPEWRRKF